MNKDNQVYKIEAQEIRGTNKHWQGKDYTVATLSKSYRTGSGIIMPRLISIGKFWHAWISYWQSAYVIEKRKVSKTIRHVKY